MSIIIGIIVLIAIFILTVVSTYFITFSWWHLRTRSNADLKKANKILFWTTILSWLGVVGLGFLIFLYITEGSEASAATGGGGIMVKLLFWVSILFLLVQGVMCSLSANYIRESGQLSSQTKAFRDIIIATSIAFGSTGGLFIFTIIKDVKQKQERQRKADNRLRSRVLNAQLRALSRRNNQLPHSTNSLK